MKNKDLAYLAAQINRQAAQLVRDVEGRALLETPLDDPQHEAAVRRADRENIGWTLKALTESVSQFLKAEEKA